MMLRVGDPFGAPALEDFLRRSGYAFDDRVDDPGEAALRGQVTDVFPTGADQPVRIDFNDGRITQICPFDSLTQRTAEIDLDHVLLLPASEIVLSPDAQEERIESGLDLPSANSMLVW
jgi:transcription-repair coupling factor (superfamily II helicase)